MLNLDPLTRPIPNLGCGDRSFTVFSIGTKLASAWHLPLGRRTIIPIPFWVLYLETDVVIERVSNTLQHQLLLRGL
jgi:hypothetical protein